VRFVEGKSSKSLAPNQISHHQKGWLIRRFQHSIVGFLSGAIVAGTGTFYYVMEEYRVSNELLTEDIYVRDPSIALYERIAI